MENNPLDNNDQFEWKTKSSYDSVGKAVGEFLVEILKVVLISLAIIIPVRYFLIQPFYVKGASMEPNFHDHEYLIINEISYRLGAPQRGDIVVFRYPNDPSQYYIKRVIGLPGEKVEFKNNKTYIYNDKHPEGLELDESAYLPSDVKTEAFVKNDYVLADDEYFVMGDNRPASYDSRRFGPVATRFLIGKAWVRGWPLNKLTIFSDPVYNLQ